MVVFEYQPIKVSGPYIFGANHLNRHGLPSERDQAGHQFAMPKINEGHIPGYHIKTGPPKQPIADSDSSRLVDKPRDSQPCNFSGGKQPPPLTMCAAVWHREHCPGVIHGRAGQNVPEVGEEGRS